MRAEGSSEVSSLNVFTTEEIPSFSKNVLFAVIAQGTGLFASVIMSLIVPKVLGLEDYAYWQMFLLYSGYAGLLLFGINDGIYLRLGGRRYGELDFSALKAQFLVVMAFQVVVALCFAIAFIFAPFDGARRTVLLLVLIQGLLVNAKTWIAYVFQSTNLTQLSSIANFTANASFLVSITCAMLFGANHFQVYIVLNVVCQALTLAYCLICGRRILGAHTGALGLAIRSCVLDAGSGLFVMAAYYADILIIGSTRMLTDWFMGITAFGKLSFAFSMTTFVLTFLGQVAMVAFPVIKRLNDENRRQMYVQIRDLLLVFLPLIYFAYLPIRHILGLWLPQYEQSFIYLALTLPFCIYSCKSSLLFTTYLKTERGERTLCLCNVVALAVNICLSGTSIILLRSVELASIGIVISVAARDLVYNLIFFRRYNVSFIGESLLEASMAAVFMVSSWFLDLGSVFVVAAAYTVYLLLQRKRASSVFRFALGRVGGGAYSPRHLRG